MNFNYVDQYFAGADAAEAGKDISTNPNCDPDLFRAWVQGFNDADYYVQKNRKNTKDLDYMVSLMSNLNRHVRGAFQWIFRTRT